HGPAGRNRAAFDVRRWGVVRHDSAPWRREARGRGATRAPAGVANSPTHESRTSRRGAHPSEGPRVEGQSTTGLGPPFLLFGPLKASLSPYGTTMTLKDQISTGDPSNLPPFCPPFAPPPAPEFRAGDGADATRWAADWAGAAARRGPWS